MRRHRRDSQEERPFAMNRVIEEPHSFLCDHIGRVPTLVTDWWVMVSLISCVEISVSVGIEEKIGAVEPVDMGPVVIVDRVSVEELACIVGVVASILEPDWQEVVVEPAINEFWISTWAVSASVQSLRKSCEQHSPYGGLTSVTFVLCG